MRIPAIVLSTIALAGFAFAGLAETIENAETEKTDEAPLRLTITLSDGSRIIGVPAVETIGIHAVFGRVDVPLAQIASVTFDADNERITIAMSNGDRLSGVHNLGELKLTTLFGDVEIDAFHIRKIECDKQ